MKKIFTFKNLLLISFYIFIFSLFLKNSYSYLDPDFGWHLKFGQETLETKSVPHIEHVSFALFGQRWVDHEWLLNVVVYLIYSKFGYLTLNLFFAIIPVVTFILLNNFLIKKHNLNTFHIFFLMLIELLAIFGILPHSGIRVQEINFLFLFLLLLILFKFDKNKNYKILFFVPPLMFLWSCLHGGFLVGFAVLFLFFCVKILELILKKFTKFNFIEYSSKFYFKDFVMFASVSIFSFLLTFLGPYGLELYSFLYQYRDTFYLMHVSEWLPVYYPTVMASKFFYLIITIAFLIFSIFYTRFKKINIFSFLLTLIFLVLSIKSKRHFPLLFICSIYFIVDYLILIFDEISIRADNFIEKMHFLNKEAIIFIPLFLSVSIFASIYFMKDPFLYFKDSYPLEILDCIRDEKENNQRIFSNYDWGGYMIWMIPEAKLFLDGRLPQYPFANGKSILQEYNNFYLSDNTEELLDKYDIKMVFINNKIDPIKFNWLERFLGYNENKIKPRKNNLRDYLDSSDKWRLLCEKDLGIVFVRK